MRGGVCSSAGKQKHTRKSQDLPNGGIIEREGPIHISNVKLLERPEDKKKKPAAKASETPKSKATAATEEKAKKPATDKASKEGTPVSSASAKSTRKP